MDHSLGSPTTVDVDPAASAVPEDGRASSSSSTGGAEADAEPARLPAGEAVATADDSAAEVKGASAVVVEGAARADSGGADSESAELGQSQANSVESVEPTPEESTSPEPAVPPKQATLSSYATLSTPADPSSSTGSAPLPAPYPEPTARALAVPYRAAFKPKPKGILKPPTVQQARFNFRRDVLNPFNARLSVAAYGAPPGPGPGQASATQGSTEAGSSSGAGTTPALSVGGGAAAGLVQGTAAAAAAAGGFWGSALKKLSGVGVPLPVHPSGPAPQRDLSDDSLGPTLPTAAQSPSAAPPSQAPASPTMDRRHPHPSALAAASLDGPAPHTPTKSPPSAGSISSSPYATIKATLSPATAGPSARADPLAPPPLDVRELRKVRFRVASLKVVYPINGPNGPLAPWQEGETRRRVNTEFRRARQALIAGGGDSKGWTGEALGRLYAESCRTRDEPGIERVKRAFRVSIPSLSD